MKHIALLAVLTVMALLLPFLVRDAAAPAPDEPPLRMAPQRYFEPVVPIQKLDLPPIEKPIKREVPPGAKCLDDCPLIDPAVVEEQVRAFYADKPVLIAIAGCESHFKHYDEQGNVLTNKQGSSATGVMQIMASVHASEAEKLGLSIRDFKGNLEYAAHLYDTQGTAPWEASSYCWQHAEVATVALNNTISYN